jgi:hypothetical protein
VPEDEGFFAADDPGALQFGGNAAAGVSGAEHDKCLAGWFDRGQDRPGKPAPGTEDSNQNEPEQLSHNRDSLDEVSGNPRLTMVMRLLDEGFTRTAGRASARQPADSRRYQDSTQVSHKGFEPFEFRYTQMD